MITAVLKDERKSPVWLKSGYGSAEVGLTAMEIMLQVYLLELYLRAGLDPLWAGAALALAVIWDAISDPLMGWISDRTPARNSRGKRLPYLILGIPISMLAFVFLFSPAQGGTDLELGVRLLCWYLILNTAVTLIIVPYLALINDLAKDAQERSEYFGWRLVFSGLGLIVGLSIPPIVAALAGQDVDELGTAGMLENRSSSAYWLAIALGVFVLLAVAAVWKRSGNSQAESSPVQMLSVLRVCIRSKAFLVVIGTFVFISIGRAVNASLALIFYKGTLGFSDSQVAVALIGLSVVVMIATPVWVWMGKRWNKGRCCVWGSLGLSILTAVAYPLLPPQSMVPVAIVVILGGLSVASVVLLESLFSDVIESDSRENDMSLTGSYYGLWRLTTKFARAIGLAVSGVFLWFIGYQEGVLEQESGVYQSVAWAFGPGVAIFFGLGTYLLWRGVRANR
ncbi:MFS transporter [Pelagicoccus mobilis]|uniref:MFS transporter n=1 Tax=Pelagicoccus mobilis TaxID=415221 RepID=A0A934VQV5_9BACT|nr:MFS transporter [Pelagicoccus mobilis]MBK1876968.1 MFS transporter [Pelagicoccus mobilis]